MECTCTAPGHCPLYDKVQTQQQWRICRGEAVNAAGVSISQEDCDAYKRNWLAHKNRPSLLRQAANLVRDGVRHAASGMALVDDATREWRRSQCLACELFDAKLETCMHPQCGCGMKKQRGIIDALGWASKQCPIGRWAYAPIETRNLIYHVCPLASNDGWRQNVRQLLRRWPVFNGQRIIAINTGEGMESPSEVHREFQGEDYEFLLVENDRELREVATFLPLLETVQSLGHGEATFYAHTKGNSTAAAGLGDDGHRGVMYWRNAMYHHLLDEWQECMVNLQTFPTVGCHKLIHPPGRSLFPTKLMHGDWMFAGTYFWFRNDCVFARPDWRNVPRDRYGAEAWPAGLFSRWQAKSVFQCWPENEVPRVSPYHPHIYQNPISDDPL